MCYLTIIARSGTRLALTDVKYRHETAIRLDGTVSKNMDTETARYFRCIYVWYTALLTRFSLGDWFYGYFIY